MFPLPFSLLLSRPSNGLDLLSGYAIGNTGRILRYPMHVRNYLQIKYLYKRFLFGKSIKLYPATYFHDYQRAEANTPGLT
ncbi:hypothetical protein F5Y01DRAFT_272596 [Xylaria sp. FL0043]|nr:hypothetical protein F5Y01DRAFT_272596 [Xylaria sp. FL0043]